MKTSANTRPCGCCGRRIKIATHGKAAFCSMPCRKAATARRNYLATRTRGLAP